MVFWLKENQGAKGLIILHKITLYPHIYLYLLGSLGIKERLLRRDMILTYILFFTVFAPVATRR